MEVATEGSCLSPTEHNVMGEIDLHIIGPPPPLLSAVISVDIGIGATGNVWFALMELADSSDSQILHPQSIDGPRRGISDGGVRPSRPQPGSSPPSPSPVSTTGTVLVPLAVSKVGGRGCNRGILLTGVGNTV